MSTSILVVEDEPAIQELISVNLSFAGHKVLRAFDAEQAQTLIRAELPDLILLDWMLPGASGITLAKTLRSDERSEEHTSELQSLMRISYAVFCLKKKKKITIQTHIKTR